MSLRTLRTGLLAIVVVLTAGLAPGAMSQAQTPVPTCFGAPAMDPTMPCVDRLSTVTPTVAGVDDEPMVPCRPLKAPAAVHVCAFGASKSRARLRLALIGDSHTFAWRAALDQLGQSQGWRGYSLAEAACMFSEATKSLPAGPREHCLAAYRATLGWLRSHPEIDVVITTHEADTALDVPEGRTNDAKIAGFRRTWKALPRSIKRVIVLRDTPNASRDELQCVERASASGVTAAARACAEPRSWELTKDVAVAAARGLHSARYRVVDLSDLICSPVVCHPEVGGVLINRDTTGHVTQTFARTTAPYLLRRLAPLLP
jgi:hypothetical protein